MLKKAFRLFRYFTGFCVLALIIMVQSGACSFRTSDLKQTQAIVKKGQQKPIFYNYRTTDNRNIHYTYMKGQKDSLPLVIFVHGSPGSSDAFLPFLADTNLSKICQMISVDRLGFGYSEYGKGEKYLAKQSESLKNLILRHKAPFTILAGHSLGGPLIAKMAMDYPELIDGLIILAGSIDPQLEPNEWYRPLMAWWGVRWMFAGSFVASNVEIMHLKKDLQEMLPHWKNIRQPVILIQGTKDILVNAKNADFAQKMLINAQKLDIRLLKGKDHFFIWTMPETVHQAISDMINGYGTKPPLQN